MLNLFRLRSLSAVFTLLVVSLLAQAQTYTVLHTFTGYPEDGAQPNGELIQDASGSLYGTTYGGGTYFNGTVFNLDISGNETILHNFSEDGQLPLAGLLRDSEGSLYGTTFYPGEGTTFKLDSSNTLKTLHAFGGNDGGEPQSRLVTINGDLYGVTQFGGDSKCVYGCGVIFKVTKGGTETVLYRFTGGSDGGYPQGVIRDSAGNLYGVASISSPGTGTIWKLSPSDAFTVLYRFNGGADGGRPIGRLILSNDGSIHGVTYSGGDPTCNCGVVFRLDSSGHETVIHKFFGYGGGELPTSGLLDVDGTLYGTTSVGGDLKCAAPQGCGVLYQIGRTGQYTVLHRFGGITVGDGDFPGFGGLTRGADGAIYGATWHGGKRGTNCSDGFHIGCGVIFKYTPS